MEVAFQKCKDQGEAKICTSAAACSQFFSWAKMNRCCPVLSCCQVPQNSDRAASAKLGRPVDRGHSGQVELWHVLWGFLQLPGPRRSSDSAPSPVRRDSQGHPATQARQQQCQLQQWPRPAHFGAACSRSPASHAQSHARLLLLCQHQRYRATSAQESSPC